MLQINKQYLPVSEYKNEITQKSQIIIHHTVSGSNAVNVITQWATTPEDVGTEFVISGDGTIYAAFPEGNWAQHLGLKLAYLQGLFKQWKKPLPANYNDTLNKQSIGIELCNYGLLTLDADKKYRTIYKTQIADASVVTYAKAFRGSKYFHKYTPQQINALKELLLYLTTKYQIPKTYQADMWDVSQNALTGNKGIYTHVSYRNDKSDCHPQPELISMLQSL